MIKSDIIKVLLVDDHAVVRSGLKAFFSVYDDMDLVGEASDGEEAIRLCEHAQPDIVLMDILMPNMDGIAATHIIKKRWPNINIIALTSFDKKEMVSSALEAGATSYLLKNTGSDEIARAIRLAAAGKSTLSEEATRALVSKVQETPEKAYDLTKREMELLDLMTKGLSNREIGKRLIITQNTVRFHVSNILLKLNVSSRTEAVAVAIKHGLVS